MRLLLSAFASLGDRLAKLRPPTVARAIVRPWDARFRFQFYRPRKENES